MYIFSLFLSLHYLIEVLLLKLLSNSYNLKKILINSFLITFIILILLFPKDIILQPKFDYILLIFFSLNIIFGLFVWYNIIKKNYNLGKVDGIAIAVYLPILTLISSLVFKQKIKSVNLFGIILISIGAYFTLN
tara:strand:+ start:133 stop:534 length:402 start_codon:yes stop_codon:yes gene_type:complete